MFALWVLFTIKPEYIQEFDAYMSSFVSKIKKNEPDTLLYVSHEVTTSPSQRLLYELYRNHSAFLEHESKEYVKSFILERNKYLLERPEVRILSPVSVSIKTITLEG